MEIVRTAAETGFSGSICVDAADGSGWSTAFGQASRRFGVANRSDTPFGIASATKGLTALTVISLIEDALLTLGTSARQILGADLPLVDDTVTIEHLLAHRSGIGDYLDEDAGFSVSDYVLSVPVHRLDCTEAYLEVLRGHPMVFTPGERFAYCNSGYVLLALIVERIVGRPFAEVLQHRGLRSGRHDDYPLRTR